MATKKKTKAGRGRPAGSRTGSKAGDGRGRRLSGEERQKRLEMLKQHGTAESPDPWTGEKIASALGISLGTWAVWKSNQMNAKGASGKKGGRGRGRPPSGARLDGVMQSIKTLRMEQDKIQRVLVKMRDLLNKAV